MSLPVFISALLVLEQRDDLALEVRLHETFKISDGRLSETTPPTYLDGRPPCPGAPESAS